ncbi:MAG TPA: ATP-dependent 6-phosphofructokinase [Dongiaceae bacterium]|nr:ATP-dependent 6-phosphofructokinase [Dongiaceae bacterium]
MTITTLGECRFPTPRNLTVPDTVWIPDEIQWSQGRPPAEVKLFETAGPRAKLFFDPKQTRAGVVTCGGLCPGMNNVIRSLVHELYHGYGVRDILGFRGGYRGLDPERGLPPLELNPDLVDDIHQEGGTILDTSRGPVDTRVAVDHLVHRGVNLLFTIGGDGTQRGGKELYEEARRRKHPLAVVGIPKTVDNDVMYVARTFGFATAAAAARDVITCAHTEAHSVFNGVSLVKLMGRHAGFIAAAASVASQDVNFCLIPEVPFQLEGVNGLLACLQRRLVARHHAVIVVAEGAGQEIVPGETGQRDASGNVKLQDIGHFLRERIAAHFKAEQMEITLRYFDPNYLVRSVPANPEDAILCDRFARSAVHAAMAGKTGLIIGLLHEQFVHVPIELLGKEQKAVDPRGDLWRAVLATTGQPVMFG